MKRFLFLILSLPTVLTAQWRMVSSSVSLNSTVDDSTYVIDVDFFSDLTGGGYLVTGITADFLVFSQTGELYDITAATNLTLSSGRLTIVEIDNEYVNTEGAPTGQILVYDPQGEYIPVTPFGNTNMGNVLQGAAISYNSRVKNQLAIATIDDTSTIINPYEGQLVYIKATGNYQVRGAYTWSALDPGGGSGDVTGPGTSTDEAVARYNGNGNTIQNSVVTIDDSGNVNVPGNITITGDVDGRNISDDGSKLDGIEDNATADQSDAEIETAYNNRVDIVSQVIAEAGTSTTVYRWTPERVKQAIAALSAAASSPDSASVLNDSLFLYYGAVKFFVGRADHMITPEQFGAVGDGVAFDTDALNAAIVAARSADLTIMLKPGATYLIDDELGDNASNGPWQLYGYGATIKRSAPRWSTLATSALVTDDFIEVVDVDSFEVGNQIVVLDKGSTHIGQDYRGVSRVREITSIGNDTLYLDGALDAGLGATFAITDTVLVVYDMIGDDAVKIYGVTFDGNKNAQKHFGWTPNSTIDRLETGSVVRDCKFINIPNENIFVGNGAVVINNYADSLNGSFVHFSSDFSNPQGSNIISGNIVHHAGLVDFDISGHNEAVFTCSNKSQNVICTNNVVQDCGNALFGNTGSADDYTTIIQGNIAKNTNGAVIMRAYDSEVDSGVAELALIIEGNIFYNSVAFFQSGNSSNGQLVNGEAFLGLQIKNNTLVNTVIDIKSVADGIISGNYMRFDSTYTPSANTLYGSTTPNAAIVLERSSNCKIIDNILYRDRWSPYNIEAAIEVGYGTSPPLVQRAGIDTVYTTYGHHTIAHNTIQGFSVGFDESSTAGTPRGYSNFGVDVYDNKFYQRDSSDVSGLSFIRVIPGVRFYDNYIACNSATTRGLLAIGVNAANEGRINGPIIYDNYIVGCNEAAQLGRTDGDDWNIVFVRNFYGGILDIRPASGLGNQIHSNIQLPVNENVPLDWLRLRRNIKD